VVTFSKIVVGLHTHLTLSPTPFTSSVITRVAYTYSAILHFFQSLVAETDAELLGNTEQLQAPVSTT